jgi:hypothetical protein
MCTLVTGCGTLTRQAQNNISQTDNQSNASSERVELERVRAGNALTRASSATQNINKGLRWQEQRQEPVKLPDGSIYETSQVLANGQVIKTPIMATVFYDVSFSTHADLTGGAKGASLGLGTVAPPTTMDKYNTFAQRDILRVTIDETGGTATNAESISALRAGAAAEKAAAGAALVNAIAAEWEGKEKQLLGRAVVIKQLGESIEGVLATLNPISGTTKAVATLIKDGIAEPEVKIIDNPDALQAMP